mmetsp:Transcript_4289/g.6589  ORF Transcript_4289/g.6589 Transcript_4289/m.6589 type:complete len:396 (+) Transcript_4289:99-1286(+)|eukprot:CAMPEP_0196812866 /NCGR_PEP_ID=MMETSP1362-20130617/31848_1 /TAXON_ID=163516 /ORGANISM="Leptocylindrus danicus, Strain CCMP1856" /LENGTH=395 /DNA_ID=CAMNT_0042188793 /DNA_START=40 /DNA_END=1227 /DNA_ORIENTATION=+
MSSPAGDKKKSANDDEQSANENNHSAQQTVSLAHSATAARANTQNKEDDDEEEPGRVIFPIKLHRILTSGKHDDVICWMPHGRCWKVLKPTVFERDVMPRYFKQTKYSSFTRQVNGWNYRRIHSGKDKGCYYHEYFQRDSPDLCYNMKRSSRRKTTDPFYGEFTMAALGNRMNANDYRTNPQQSVSQFVSLRHDNGSGIPAAGTVDGNSVGLGNNPMSLQQSLTNSAILQQQQLQQQLQCQLNLGQTHQYPSISSHAGLFGGITLHQYQQALASSNTVAVNNQYNMLNQQHHDLSLLSQQQEMAQYGSQLHANQVDVDESFVQASNVFRGGIAATNVGQASLPPLQGGTSGDPQQNQVRLVQQPANIVGVHVSQQQQSSNSQSNGKFHYHMPPPA